MNTTFARALALGAIVAASVLTVGAPRASACDGIHDLSCVINPVERLSGANTGSTAPREDDAQAQQTESVGAPTNIRPARSARQTAPRHSLASAAKKRDAKRAAEDEARAQVIAGSDKAQDEGSDKIQDRVTSDVAARAYAPSGNPTPANAPSSDDAWTASQNATRGATSGKLDTQAIWSAASDALGTRAPAGNAPVVADSNTATSKPELVDASAFNEIDRQAEASAPAAPFGRAGPVADATSAKPLEAMAMMDSAEETRSWWQDGMPLGETSTIGQIFVLIGGLLTVGTVLRMFLA